MATIQSHILAIRVIQTMENDVPVQLSMNLSRLDAECCPVGVPQDVWALFVREADRVRSMGRDHYGARTLLEVIRHHQVIDAGNRDFIINNNWQASMSRAYMNMRNCWRFFEIRDRAA